MKNSHMKQYISVQKVIKALQKFQELDNKHYRNLTISNDYEGFVRHQDPDGFSLIFPENSDANNVDNFEEGDLPSESNTDNDEEHKYNTENPVYSKAFKMLTSSIYFLIFVVF